MDHVPSKNMLDKTKGMMLYAILDCSFMYFFLLVFDSCGLS